MALVSDDGRGSTCREQGHGTHSAVRPQPTASLTATSSLVVVPGNTAGPSAPSGAPRHAVGLARWHAVCRQSSEMPTVARARVLACLGAILTLLSACARQPAPRTGGTGATNTVVTDSIWYMSVRARDEDGRDTRQFADSMEYGIAISRVGNPGTLALDALSRDVDLALLDSVRLTKADFVRTLRQRARNAPAPNGVAGDSLVVLMVHGFGTGLHEAWDYASQARLRSRSTAPWVVFCWPSNGSGIAWPRAGQILVRAYREDSIAASNSRPALAASLGTLLEATASEQLLVVAHSLGAQLVGETLAADSGLRRELGASPLRALAYFAPDVATTRFNDVVLPATMPLARRVVIYASSNDKLLALSRAVNGSERAGLLRGKPSPPRGLELVDVTRGLSAETRLQRAFGSHHALRRATSALYDLFTIVANGLSATCRERRGTARVNARGIWELTAVLPPWQGTTQGCVRHQ